MPGEKEPMSWPLAVFGLGVFACVCVTVVAVVWILAA